MEKNERLTQKYVEEFEGVQTGKVRFILKNFLLPLPILLDRIGRYEETGLSPEEIEELKHNHEKLQDFEVQNNEQLRRHIAQSERENQRLREESEMNSHVEELVKFLNHEAEAELRGTQIRLKAQKKINEMLLQILQKIQGGNNYGNNENCKQEHKKGL